MRYNILSMERNYCVHPTYFFKWEHFFDTYYSFQWVLMINIVNFSYTVSAIIFSVKYSIVLQKQIGCFNHRVVTPVADKLWL